MMSGCLYIDGLDVYSQFGLYAVDQGWNELIAFPPLKEVDTNDWQEEDGVEPDLESPMLDTREVQVTFAVVGALSSFMSFMELLSDGAYHTFDIRSIGRTYKLRLVSHPSYSEVRDLENVTLKFSDDFPMEEYTYEEPQSTLSTSEEYDIDDILLSIYGVRVLSGSLASVKTTAQVKLNMLRNVSSLSGAIYDGGKTEQNKNVQYQSKEVKLTCLMRADSLPELWRNWDALLFNLTKPGEHMLYVPDIVTTFPFYYKKCQVSKFYPDNKIWLEFSLTLVFFKDFRITDDIILCMEDGTPVCLEDNETFIDLTPNK
jgi:hypothetical protein